MKCDGWGEQFAVLAPGFFRTRALRREKAVARTKAANGAMGALSYEFSFLSAHDPHLENGIALTFLDTIGSKLCFESRQHERTAECRIFLAAFSDRTKKRRVDL